jgi:hypothetical protein
MKLYWRYKKDGKWTWKPGIVTHEEDYLTVVKNLEAQLAEEEE